MADASYPRIAEQLELWSINNAMLIQSPLLSMGIHAHGTELEAWELLTSLPLPMMYEKDRTARIEIDYKYRQ